MGRLPTALAAVLAAALLPPAAPAAGQDKGPAKEAPLDADLPPEREIQREARSDPRNLKPDAFPAIRKPVYTTASSARKMDPGEWVIGVVLGKTALAFPVNVLNHHEILMDDVDGVAFMVCW